MKKENINNEYLNRIISADDVVSAERVSYYGLRVCLVTYNENYYSCLSPHVLYLEESVKPLRDKYGITSLSGLAGLGLPAVEGRREIQGLEAAIVGTPEDKLWLDSIEKDIDDIDDCDFFSEDEVDIPADATVELGNLNDEFAWHDLPFTDTSGLQGVKDCWGRIIIPAVYEKCRPSWIGLKKAVPVKREGKWGFADRESAGSRLTGFVFDNIEEGLDNFFIVSRDNRFGIYDKNGEEIVPAVMDDISEVTFNMLFLTKRQGKFGFRFNNGVYIAPCVDEIVLPEDEEEPLRFRMGDEWKYLSDKGVFTGHPARNSLRRYELDFTGRISHQSMIDNNYKK